MGQRKAHSKASPQQRRTEPASNKAGQGRAGQRQGQGSRDKGRAAHLVKPGQDRANRQQGRAEQGRGEQGRAWKGRAGQGRAGQGMEGQGRAV